MKILYDRTTRKLHTEQGEGEEAEMLDFLENYLRERVPDDEQTIIDDTIDQILKGNRYDA